MKVLAVITARGGSKGIKNKNIKKLNGKPLISYIFNSAKKARLIGDIILSTDSLKIAKIAKKIGINVPFIRPRKLANDKSLQVETVTHAVKQYESITKKKFDIIVLLQPTCPLTMPKHINSAITLISKKKYLSAGSYAKLKDGHPTFHLIKKKNNIRLANPNLKGINSRHNLKKLFRACGNVYAIRKNELFKLKSFISKKHTYTFIEEECSVNINDHYDWFVADALVKKKYN
jgi:CMP-N,N'-diacetyllegionaminic acid synthase